MIRPTTTTLPRLFARTHNHTHTQTRNLARMAIIGRLAAEPEEVATASGKSLLRYAVGTSHGPRENRQTSWFQVACFDEGVGRSILMGAGKGALVHVDADGRMRSIEDTETGKRTNRLDLVQRSIEVLSRPRPAEGGSDQAAATNAAGAEAGDEAV